MTECFLRILSNTENIFCIRCNTILLASHAIDIIFHFILIFPHDLVLHLKLSLGIFSVWGWLSVCLPAVLGGTDCPYVA